MSCKCSGASNLRNRITIEQLARTPDGSGGWSEAWSTFATVWAKITPKTYNEKWIGNQTTEVITHQIVIRKKDGILSEMRIKFKDRYFYIKGHIDQDELGRYNIIKAQEGVTE